MSSEIPKNTVASIAASINSKFSKLQIAKKQVSVTSVRQEGSNVRAFFVINRAVDLSPEEVKRLNNPIARTHLVMPDPFADGETSGDVQSLSTSGEFVPVTSITPSPVGEIKVGETVEVTVSVLPSNATDTGYTAVSSNPEILEVLNSGAALLGKGTGGNAIITYTSTDGNNIVGTLQVRVVVPVVYPSAVNPTFNTTSPKVGDVIEVTDAGIAPSNTTDKSFTVVSSDPTVAVVVENKATVLKAGAFTLTVSTNTGSNKKQKVTNFTATDPNKNSSYLAKLSYKDVFGENTDYVAKYANPGDVVNLIVKGVDLVENQQVTIKVNATGCLVNADSNVITLEAGKDLVIPVTVASASTTTANFTVEVLVGNTTKVTTTAVNVNKTVVASNAQLETLPDTVKAGDSLLPSVTVNAKYTARSVAWSITPANGATITTDKSADDLLAMIAIAGNVAVDTKYTVSVTVDGVTLTSNEVTVVAAD